MTIVRVLDCTLRDGGYINEWDFGTDKTKQIVNLLEKSGVEYIETGFITSDKTTSEKTLFNSFKDVKNFIPDNSNKDKLFGMIKYGAFPIEEVPDVKDSILKGIRLIFKKHQKQEALKYCKSLKEKGYKLFINPTFTDQYSDSELIELIDEVNRIKPYAFSVVDSMGVFKQEDILRLYHLINNNLYKNIALCFHFHNNLQLSFSNAQCLMKTCKNRELVIDSTVFGMGRGAGNLCTELIIKYINDNYDNRYEVAPILKIIDEYINPIFINHPWGYSIPYYLTSINHCHPNYAKFLIDKQVSNEIMNNILQNIPNVKKATYDKSLIEQIFADYKTKNML